jgi:hypothetical protein
LADGADVYENNPDILKVLISIDADGNPDNGIKVDEDAVKKLESEGIEEISHDNLDDALDAIASVTGKKATDADVEAHLAKATKSLLGGKTFYPAFYEGEKELESWTFQFDDDGDEGHLTWKEYFGEGELDSGTDLIVISGRGFRLPESENEENISAVILQDQEEDGYMTLLFTENGKTEVTKLFYKKIDAETDATYKLLAGKTYYTNLADDDGNILPGVEKWTFDEKLTKLSWEEIEGGDSSGVDKVSKVEGFKIYLNSGEEEIILEIKGWHGDGLVVSITEDGESSYAILYGSKDEVPQPKSE